MSLTPQEEQELERLLLMLEHWEQVKNPARLTAAPGVADISEKSNQPKESKAKPAEEPRRDFIDGLCGPGSDKPSGRSFKGKFGFME